MARFTALSLLACTLAGTVYALPEQHILDAPQALAKWSYDNCGSPTDVIQLESIVVSPDPPEPGKNLTVTVKGTALDTIEEGAVADVTVKLGLIKILHKEFDICEEARKANATIQCPIEKGTYTVSQTVELPKQIPKGSFNVEVLGFTADDEDMLCLKIHMDFRNRPFFGVL